MRLIDPGKPAISKRLQADLLLLLVAVFYGTVFVVQRVAAVEVGTFLFNGIRFLLGALVLVPLVKPSRQVLHGKVGPILLAGVLLFGGSAIQQAGLVFTTAGNAGFITGLYVILVPVILWIGWRLKQGLFLWFSALLAAAGMFLLSVGVTLRINPGDLLELAGAAFWAGHMVLLGRVIRNTNLVQFSIGQYLVCGTLSLGVGLFTEREMISGLAGLWWALLYAGIISVGLAYTLQAYAQRQAPPADAAIILSSESVFAAISGYLFLGEKLRALQILGCGMMLFAILLVQLKNRQGMPGM
jgi:drug/metabolite transporter (DMT)-like permease